MIQPNTVTPIPTAAMRMAQANALAREFITAHVFRKMLALGIDLSDAREMEGLPPGVREECARLGRELATSSERIAAIMERMP